MFGDKVSSQAVLNVRNKYDRIQGTHDRVSGILCNYDDGYPSNNENERLMSPNYPTISHAADLLGLLAANFYM